MFAQQSKVEKVFKKALAKDEFKRAKNILRLLKEIYVFWCLFGLPLAAMTQWFFIKGKLQENMTKAQGNIQSFIYLGCLIFLMQYMTMLVFSQLFVAYSLALFQLSMVLQVFLGYRIFNEQYIWRRLSACLVMVAGSLLVLNA